MSESLVTETSAELGPPSRAQNIRYAVTSIFILWTMFAVGVWVAPESSQRTLLLRYVKPFLDGAGLSQDFVVFSPSVDTSNAELTAIVSFADGSRVLWRYPRMPEWSLFERLFKDSYTTYVFNLHRPKLRFLLPDTARYILREVRREEPARHPVSVTLCWEWEEIVLPAENRQPKKGVARFFEYQVKPEDLQ